MGQIFFLEFLKILGGAANAGFGSLLTLLKSGFNTAVKFHQEGIAFAREMGMSAKEAQAYTEVLTERTENLAAKYGVAAEQVIELQKNISVATSRQLMLNDAQAEQFLQINKLVGSSTVSKFTDEMMNGMGGSLQSVTGAVSKAYTLASKSGLNAQKISEKIANNLNLANKLSFRTGIDGLTRMAMQAEKIGMNLQTIDSVANKFMDFESAIESSAQLSMLGGAAGAIGGNPLDMMYEANYDPEALQKRIPQMLSGLAKFDPTKGVAHLNGFAQEMARNIGKGLGIDPTEAVNIAKRTAANQYKEQNISPRLRNMGLSQEQMDFLINKSDVKDGKVSLTTANNETIDLGAVSKSGEEMKKLLDEMMKYDNMSEKDIMEQNAQTLTSINEQLSGISASISAMFSGFLNGLLPGITKDIKDYGAWAKQKLEPLAKDMGKSVREAYNTLKVLSPVIKTLGSGLIKFMQFVTQHWKLTLAAILAIKAAKYIGGISLASVGKAPAQTIGQAASSKMFNGIKNIGSNIWSASKGMSEARYDYNYLRHPMGGGRGRFMSAVKAPFRAFGRLSGTGKALVGGSAALGVGLGAYNAITADNTADRGAGIGTAVGTALGAVVGGPIGAAIGGFLGDFAGRFVGEHWDDITGAVSKAWDSISSWFKTAWDGWLGDTMSIIFPVIGVIRYWDEISKFVSDKSKKIIGLFERAADGFIKFVNDPWGTTKNVAKAAINKGKEFFGFSVSNNSTEKHSVGGAVGGNITNAGDTIMNMSTESHSTGGTIGGNVTNLGSSIMNLTTEKHSVGGAVGGNITNAGDTIMTVSNNSTEKHSSGGSVGRVTKPEGEDILTWLKKGEIVLNEKQQKMFTDNIQAMPVGQKEYIYVPQNTSTSNVGNNKVTVDAIKVNVGGTIRIDMGGGNTRELDSRAYDIIAQKVSEYFTNQFNLKAVNDTAYVSGAFMPTSLYGKMKTTT